MIRIAVVILLVAGCAAAPASRVPVPMDCVRDGIDAKICEWNCRNAGRDWTGTECRARPMTFRYSPATMVCVDDLVSTITCWPVESWPAPMPGATWR